MSTYLKIKIASLAAEARIIRNEEQKLLHKHRKWRAKAESRKGTLPPALFFNLEQHRKHEVRAECRAAHLAQGFIKGTPYHSIERFAYTPANWTRVAELVKKYGGHNSTAPAKDRVEEWRKGTAAVVADAA